MTAATPLHPRVAVGFDWTPLVPPPDKHAACITLTLAARLKGEAPTPRACPESVTLIEAPRLGPGASRISLLVRRSGTERPTSCCFITAVVLNAVVLNAALTLMTLVCACSAKSIYRATPLPSPRRVQSGRA